MARANTGVAKLERRDMPVPQWSKRAAIGTGGRDPLGLSRVAQMLTDSLLPGIITTTSRARYYALYPWILWHARETGEATSFDEFRSAFQRREAAIAIATILSGDSNPVGVEAVKRKLSQGEDDGTVSVNFKVLPSNPLGGYGQYYSGCLYKLGLTERDEAGIDNVRGPLAEKLARAVQQTLSSTPYLSQALFTKNTLRLKSLQESSDRLSLDSIGRAFARREATLVTDLLFGFGDEQPAVQMKSQRDTLSLLLWTLRAYKERRIPVRHATFEDQVLYWPTYFGALRRPTGLAVPVQFPDSLAPQIGRWRQFCLHCYLTLGIEGLLESLLQVLTTKPAGATLEDVVGELAPAVPKALKDLAGKECESPRELLALLGLNAVPDERSSHNLRARLNANHRLSEAIQDHRVTTAGQRAAKGALLLALLYSKWRGEVSDEGYLAVSRGAGGDLCAVHVLPMLDGWLDSSRDWPTALLQFASLIVKSHDRVMYEKGRLESCWLEYDGGRYRRTQDYESYRRAPRLLQAASILTDLGLIDVADSGGDTTLTVSLAGNAVLDRALEAA